MCTHLVWRWILTEWTLFIYLLFVLKQIVWGESAIATKQTKSSYKVLQFALYLVASKDI